MKRSKILIACSLLCICLIGFFSFGSPKINYMVMDREARTTVPEDLQDASDVIVVASPIGNSENVLFPDRDFGYTKTGVRVVDVVKGDVAFGDKLTITEECYTSDHGTVLWTTEGYLPMERDFSYLLFLKAYPDDSSRYSGMYYPIDSEYGKYVIPQQDNLISTLSKNDLQIGEFANVEKYTEWYEYITEHFLLNSK